MLSLVSVVLVEFLQMSKSGARIEALGAGQGAEADLIALAEFHVAAKHLKTLLGVLVTRVNDPAISLHKDGRAEVVLRVPPVAGASGLAAGAQDALVETIEELAIFHRLEVLLVRIILRCLTLQERLDLLVLGVEVRHVDDEVLQHEHEHERRNHTLLIVVLGDAAEAGQMVTSIDIHGAGAADALTARPTEAKRWINLILDLDEGVEEHGPTLVHVDVVGYISRAIVGVIRVAAVHIDALHLLLLLVGQSLIKLLRVVDLQDVADICESRCAIDRSHVSAAEDAGCWVYHHLSTAHGSPRNSSHKHAICGYNERYNLIYYKL